MEQGSRTRHAGDPFAPSSHEMRTQLSSHKSAGFSAMDTVIAVSILAVLAATLAVPAGKLLRKSNPTKVVELQARLKTLCATYHADVGSLAHEYASYPASHRQLSAEQTTAGWNGPYLASPLAHEQNPFKGQMHLYSSARVHGLGGFDLDGDGSVDVRGAANVLYLSSVPGEQAQEIDARIDGEIAGLWSEAGRVRYNESNSHLHILVYHEDQ